MTLIFLILISQLFFHIKSLNSQCSNDVKITNSDCFNNVIILPQYYRGAQFSTNKEGTMLIEYSKDYENLHGYRLFYAFKKNGRNLYEEESEDVYKIFEIGIGLTNNGRYEARNLFVCLEDDINKDKEYLFSTSSYDTLTELHDIENDKSVTKGTLEFWNIIDIFSYQYSLFELRQNNKNIYFCIFTQHEIDQIKINNELKDYSKTYTIMKFSFTSFDLENYKLLKSLNNTNNFNDRIISAFLMESQEILVVFYLKSYGTNYVDAKYAIIFYDYDLNEKNEIIITNDYISDSRSGEGVFFKGLCIKGDYAAFIYYLKGYDDTKIQFNITTIGQDSDGKYLFNNKIETLNTYGFISDIALNEFIKIDDERLVFITTKLYDNAFHLYILLYDLYNSYTQMKTRQYYYHLDDYQLRKELTLYTYNGFLIFSSTAVTPKSYETTNYISLLVFFGYPNGTDFEIDISIYLMDTDYYDSNDNLYNFLMQKMKVENNIFGYEIVEKINLVSIPKELLFYNITDGVKDSYPLPNNTFFDSNHVLNQNKEITKTFKYYYLDYQYIVKEPEYSDFYPSDTVDKPDTFDGSEYFNSNRKTFYGRTNRLKFKLCYIFCETCIEFGKIMINQKCSTCLEDYSYDYWAYVGKYFGNCVEQNKYYDYENPSMLECDDVNFKYFIDYSKNKKICFKSENDCPAEYSDYNETTKECEHAGCSFDSYLNKECNFNNDSDDTILEKMRELIKTYSEDLQSLTVPLEDTALEISNDKKEILFYNDTELPWIDLGECGNKLRATFRNNDPKPLIIIKYGVVSDNTSEKTLQYEVYDPDTYHKMNLSICYDTDVNLYMRIPLSDDTANVLKNMIEQGYNPFDINDKFYREICTPYDSENGTDVLLDAREEYYYSTINSLQCPENCHTTSYDLDSKYLKCECEVYDDDITLNLKHITGDNIGDSFHSTLKNSNWKVMICYNLVFNFKIFCHNYGSILSLIFFLIYVGFIVLFIIKGIEPLQIVISKIMFEEKSDNKDSEVNLNSPKDSQINKRTKKKKKSKKKVRIKLYPPKKSNSRNQNNGITIIKDSISVNESKKLKSEKLLTNVDKVKNDLNKSKKVKEVTYTEIAESKKKKDITKKKEEKILGDLDDFQLNNLNYEDAVKYDKRSFLKTYWSVLLREHLLIFTFMTWKDYNLFYIKIDRFLVLICTQMTMNGLFFSDESMHKSNKIDNYNFVQQLPKIIFSLITTHIIEVALCYFSMTDKTIYLIKELSKEKENESKIIDETKCMKKKLISFYVITFLLFLFYWYFISAFCAVYQNTQKIFLLDSFISIIVEFIDPFFIYGFTTLLRYISIIKCANKNLKCLYQTSDLIPIF